MNLGEKGSKRVTRASADQADFPDRFTRMLRGLCPGVDGKREEICSEILRRHPPINLVF